MLASSGLISKFLTLPQKKVPNHLPEYYSPEGKIDQLKNESTAKLFFQEWKYLDLEISFFQGCKSLWECKRLFPFGDVNVFFASGM